MYFHLDYHGDPVSYEWVSSTELSKIWEQMTEAFVFGVCVFWFVFVLMVLFYRSFLYFVADF